MTRTAAAEVSSSVIDGLLHGRVDVIRGGIVESQHAVWAALARVDAPPPPSDGLTTTCFARSAVKPLQSLLLVESAAADGFGLAAEHLAIAAGSHAGEPLHVGLVSQMLAAGGFTVDDLECGPQRPFCDAASDDLARLGHPPSPLHNNCSGKHAALLLAARHLGHVPAGYRRPDHATQRLVSDILADVCGLPLGGRMALDGCGIPTFAIPLPHLARGFARFATGAGLSRPRAAAAARIRAAIAAHPVAFSGTGRLDTRIAAVCGEAVLLKSGAEGVICAAIPAAGIGIAVKAVDGAARAAEAIMASLLLRFTPLPSPAATSLLEGLARPALLNRHGERVGHVESTLPDHVPTSAG